MRAADALVKAMEKQGVDYVFGIPGGANMPFYDALKDSEIRSVLMRHEQQAAHAAEGYARVKRRPGVCSGTSGPGATNLITGLVDAYMDSTPVVAITGQVLSLIHI
ncbi:MAG: thiamine pyrophosphate-binding protein, partial [Candidatus Caldarchaeum sp.]|nr:thiamine pyrophosphate-binding protein [Candidatus Caldarchaeum sp.]